MIALDLEDDDKTQLQKRWYFIVLPDYSGKGYAKLFNKYVEKYVK